MISLIQSNCFTLPRWKLMLLSNFVALSTSPYHHISCISALKGLGKGLIWGVSQELWFSIYVTTHIKISKKCSVFLLFFCLDTLNYTSVLAVKTGCPSNQQTRPIHPQYYPFRCLISPFDVLNFCTTSVVFPFLKNLNKRTRSRWWIWMLIMPC